MTNWNEFFENGGKDTLRKFADGSFSGRQVTSVFKNTELAGPFRELIRSKGVNKARQNARKALRRRNIEV